MSIAELGKNDRIANFMFKKCNRMPISRCKASNFARRRARDYGSYTGIGVWTVNRLSPAPSAKRVGEKP
jgi:hypothetical protein